MVNFEIILSSNSVWVLWFSISFKKVEIKLYRYLKIMIWTVLRTDAQVAENSDGIPRSWN